MNTHTHEISEQVSVAQESLSSGLSDIDANALVATGKAATGGPVNALPADSIVDLNALLNQYGLAEHYSLLLACLETQGIARVPEAVMKQDIQKFAKLGGVGKKKVALLIELQSWLKSNPPLFAAVPQAEPPISIDPADKGVPLFQLGWTAEERDTIGRLLHVDADESPAALPTVDTLLSLDSASLSLGNAKTLKLKTLLSRLPDLIADWKKRCAELWPAGGSDADPATIDRAIEAGVNGFLASLPERERRIAQTRWGYDVLDVGTLEGLSSEHGLTRERCRQIEKKVERDLCHALLVPAEAILALDFLTFAEIPAQFPQLGEHFKTAAWLIAFLEMLGGQAFRENLVLKAYKSHAVPHFCLNNPVSWSSLVEVLASGCKITADQSERDCKKLERLGLIRLEGDTVIPQHLSQSQAVAFVLAHAENAAGLHWRKIASTVNAIVGLASPLPSDHSDHEPTACTNNAYASLCGEGVFHHAKYLPTDEGEIAAALGLVRAILELESNTSAGPMNLRWGIHGRVLAQAAAQGLNIPWLSDYWALRAVLRCFGAKCGISFNGKSSREATSIVPMGNDGQALVAA